MRLLQYNLQTVYVLLQPAKRLPRSRSKFLSSRDLPLNCTTDNSKQRMCKWCQAECAHVSDEYSFDIHHHVHCNRPGKKICGTYPSLTLEPPPAPEKKFKKEASISDIAAPEVQFTIKKKMMTQGQRRKAEAEARRQKEEQEGSTLESAAK